MVDSNRYIPVFTDNDITLLQNSIYAMKQIGSNNADMFMEHYLKIFMRTHKALNTFTNDEDAMKRFIEDDLAHRSHSIYLMIYKNEHPVITTKATKRLWEPLRTEKELGFDIKSYLGVNAANDLSGLSLWHHSKTSADKDRLSLQENSDLLKVIHYVLYQVLIADNVVISYGEANALNIRSMIKLGIELQTVTREIQGIGMPIRGVVINRNSMRRFIEQYDFKKLLQKYFGDQ